MFFCIATFAVSFLVSFLCVPAIIKLAYKVGAIDSPSIARKVHKSPIPRMGGLAIVAGFYTSLALAFLLHGNGLEKSKLIGLTVGGFLILLLGIYDDVRGANAICKFVVQIAAAGLLLFLGFTFERVALPWGGEWEVGILGHFIALLWVVGISNAINLIDGLDGLATGVALFAVLTLAAVSSITGETAVVAVTLALAGGLAGFLIYNFHPAKIFMGDTGSLFVGFILAATGLMTNTKSPTTAVSLIPVVVLGLPILDTSLAALRRILRRRSPFSSDREHVHHKLLRLGFTHRKSVLLLWGFSVVACLTALAITYTRGRESAWILSGFGIFTLLLIHQLGYTQPQQIFSTLEERRLRSRENQKKRLLVGAVTKKLRTVSSYRELFEALKPIQSIFGYVQLQLDISVEDPIENKSEHRLSFRLPESSTDLNEAMRVSFALQLQNQRSLGRISYFYQDVRTSSISEQDRLLKRLHRSVVSSIVRLRSASSGENESSSLFPVAKDIFSPLRETTH